MQKYLNNILIEYDKQDENFVNEIESGLQQKMSAIMQFFELDELDSFKIKIWDNLEDFKHFFESMGNEYLDFIIGHTCDCNINILPERLARLLEPHKNITSAELAIVVCHEFVHICQREKLGYDSHNNGWFWEALATNLGDPEDFEWVFKEFNKYVNFEQFTDIDALEKAIFNSSYQYAYLIGYFMIENIEHSKILEYVVNEDLLQKEAGDILSSAKDYYKNYQVSKANKADKNELFRD